MDAFPRLLSRALRLFAHRNFTWQGKKKNALFFRVRNRVPGPRETFPMQRHGSERAPQPPPPSARSPSSSPASSPSGPETRSRKRQRTDSASSPTAGPNGNLGAAAGRGPAHTGIRSQANRFPGGSTNAYKTWLNNIDGTYGGYLGTKVAAHCVATGWGVGVVQCIEVQSRTMTRTPAHDAIYPSNSQPFSIVWEDNTDSVVDLRTLNLYARNHEQGLHKATSDPSPASNGARAPPGAVVSNGSAPPPPPSSSPPLSQGQALPAPAAEAAARAPPGAGIFDGVPSIPGDLVDLLTRNGTFAFLENLHESGGLWALRDYRIPRLVPRGAASEEFAASLKTILQLADRYPAHSLPLYILGRSRNSSLPSSCLARAAANLGTLLAMLSVFRKANGNSSGIRPCGIIRRS